MDGLRQARQVAQAIRRRGTKIYLRTSTSSSDQRGLINPPLLDNPTLATNAAIGATVVSLRATVANGRLLPGDVLTIGSETCTVAQVANCTAPPFSQSNLPGFAGVVLTQALTQAHTAGIPVPVTYAADLAIWAIISSFALSVVGQDSSIEMRDLRIIMAGYGVPLVTPENKLLVAGEVRTIVNAVPIYAGGTVARQEIQAR